MKKFEGIIPATLTPMDQNGNINFEAIPDQVGYLLDKGIKTIFIVGTTGEYPSLTVKERIQLAEAYQKAAENKLPLIVHVGHNCLENARQLTVHAAELGAKAVSFAPPCYFKFNDVETLVDICEKIMCKTPEMPFYYYHIPVITGINVSIKDFLIAADHRLPTLAGIKYTSEQIDTFLDCQFSFPDRYNMMFGRDEMMLMGLAGGAKAFVGSTYNFCSPLYLQIQKAFENKDIKTAQELQHKAIKMINILNQHGGGIRFGKMVLKLMGTDLGPVRLPIRPFDENELNHAKQSLNQIGFFDW